MSKQWCKLAQYSNQKKKICFLGGDCSGDHADDPTMNRSLLSTLLTRHGLMLVCLKYKIMVRLDILGGKCGWLIPYHFSLIQVVAGRAGQILILFVRKQEVSLWSINHGLFFFCREWSSLSGFENIWDWCCICLFFCPTQSSWYIRYFKNLFFSINIYCLFLFVQRCCI